MRSVASAFRGQRQRPRETSTPVPYAPRHFSSGLGSLLAPSGDEAQLKALGGNGTLFAIVDAYATAMAGVEWGLYRQLPPGAPEDAKRPAITSHAALDRWNQPNNFYDQPLFVKTVTQHLELVGKAFAVVVKDGGIPVELWPVRPDRMEIVPHAEKFIAGYIYHGPDGQLVPLENDVVIRLVQTPCPWDPYGGMGAVQAVMVDLYGAAAAAEWHRRFFQNSARPDGVIELPNSLSETEFEEFNDRWRAAHQGVNNAWRVAMLEHGATWKPTSYSPHDMMFVDLRRADAENIREAYRMSETVLGRGETLNRATAEAQMFQFASTHVVPRLEAVWKKSFLNGRLLPMYGATGQRVEFDYVSPVPEDKEAKDRNMVAQATAYEKYVASGVEGDDPEMLRHLGLPRMRVATRPAPTPAPVPAAPEPPEALAPAHTSNGHRATAPLAFGRQPHRHALPRAAADGDSEEDEPDLSELRADVDKALEALERDWQPILADQIDSLVTQVEEAVDAGDMAALKAIEVAEGLHGAETLRQALDGMLSAATERATTEAAEQDAPVDEAAAAEEAEGAAGTVALAAAVAAALAAALAASAVWQALRLWVPGAPDPPTGRQVAVEVRVQLERLKGTDRHAKFGGALHRMVNIARLSVQSLAVAAHPGMRIRATEVNDDVTCDPCLEIDGTVFAGVREAWAAYGGGGYRYCKGEWRCRGTTRLVRTP